MSIKNPMIPSVIEPATFQLVAQCLNQPHNRVLLRRRVLKTIFETKQEGSRRKGRPRWRWVENTEKDLQGVKTKRRRQKAVDREEWVSVIMESKAFRWPQAREVAYICISFRVSHN